MGTKGADITTRLSVQELGSIFRQATGSLNDVKAKVGSFVRSFTNAGGNKLEYFTPREDSAFGAADEDPPTWTVGALIPKFVGTGGGQVSIHMYVWDRGKSRDVRLYCPHTVASGSSARKAIDAVASAIAGHDANARVR